MTPKERYEKILKRVERYTSENPTQIAYVVVDEILSGMLYTGVSKEFKFWCEVQDEASMRLIERFVEPVYGNEVRKEKTEDN